MFLSVIRIHSVYWGSFGKYLNITLILFHGSAAQSYCIKSIETLPYLQYYKQFVQYIIASRSWLQINKLLFAFWLAVGHQAREDSVSSFTVTFMQRSHCKNNGNLFRSIDIQIPEPVATKSLIQSDRNSKSWMNPFICKKCIELSKCPLFCSTESLDLGSYDTTTTQIVSSSTK